MDRNTSADSHPGKSGRSRFTGSFVPFREELGYAFLRRGPAGHTAREDGDVDGLKDLFLGRTVVLRDLSLRVDAVLAHPDGHAGERDEPLRLLVQGPVGDHDAVHDVNGIDQAGI